MERAGEQQRQDQEVRNHGEGPQLGAFKILVWSRNA